MPRFVFRLQALLEQRLRAEQEKQLVVAAFERQRLTLEGQIGACQQEIRSHKEDLRLLLGGGRDEGAEPCGVDTRTVRIQAAASLHAQARTRRLALQLAGLYKKLEAARRELQEAMTRRRAVELLKERQFQAWRREQNRRETLEVDEIATMRAARG